YAGHVIDGVLPDDMQRGCSIKFPPCPTSYPWEALQGAVAQAELLHRASSDSWNWSGQAIRHAVQFLYDLSRQYPDGQWWPEDGVDGWPIWVVNHAYGTTFPTVTPRPGKNMGWTNWTHVQL